MSYVGGTVGGTASQEGLTLATIVKDACIAHANWTLEDTVVGTLTTYFVIKNAAAGNSAGIDWRLFVGYTTATPTTTFFRIAEGWDTDTNIASKAGFFNTGTGLESDNSLGTTFSVDDTATWGRCATPVVANSSRYDICVNAERMAFFTTISTQGVQGYAGLYERGAGLTSGTAPMPLCLVGSWAIVLPAVGSNSGPHGGVLTRHPKRTAGSIQNGRCMYARMGPQAGGDVLDHSQTVANAPAPHVYPMGGVGQGADAFDGRQEAAKPMIITQSPSVGGLLGYPKDVFLTRATENLTYGDTITVSGQTCTYMGNGCNTDPDVATDQPMAVWTGQDS